MRGLLKWIFVALAIIVIILILVNVANKSKVKPKVKEPDVYERSSSSNRDSREDAIEGLEPITTDNTAQSIEMTDTASFSTLFVFLGTFIVSGGIYYIYKKQTN